MTKQELLDNFPKFETQNLILKKIDNIEHQQSSPFTLDDFIAFYGWTPDIKDYTSSKIDFKYFDFGTKYWLIKLKNNNQIVGACQLMDWDELNNSIGIAYLTTELHREKGIMTEAITKIIDFIFNEMKIRKITAKIHSNNTPGIILVKNIGFIKAKVGKELTHPIYGTGEIYTYVLEK